MTIKYTYDDLVRILESYQRMIERNGKEFPTVVISDMEASLAFVLEQINKKETDAMTTPTVESYALKILEEHGCDCYTYGGESGETIIRDLKETYPDGMENGYGYVEVANAILRISKVKPIKRAPYHMIYDGDSFCDGVDCESYEEAKDQAEECLVNWMVEERNTWKDVFNPTEEELENYNYMIYNCGTWIEKYNPETDEYEECGGLSYEDEMEIGWKELTMEDIEKEREELNHD